MSRRHWANLGESTFVAGTWLLYGVYRVLGRWPFRLCLFPVVFVYWLASPVARRASLDYLRHLQASQGVFDRPPGWRQSLRHFACFAETLLDKMLAIGGRFPRERVRFSGHEQMLADARGGVMITAHMGCLELMQMAAGWREGLRVTILVHTAHAQRFNRILERLNPRASVRLMQVADFSPGTAVLLAERVAAGEYLAIAGDRVPVSGDRTARADFLGQAADWPAGPYLIAAVLACPVYLMACLHEGAGYRSRIQRLAERIVLPRADRQSALDAYAGQYSDWLAASLRESPYDWFNFYPFWESATHARNTH